ncbi:hypothetical protein B7494_g4597 [Chlorociboria aeruginascens]|nr:hypothetical protein B7494_g4597 [Chlorociboria aeruginascens]
MMEISAGGELMEQQNLGDLVKAAQELDPSSGAECPIQVVIQCPIVAMLYRKSTNTVRRIQLKFHNKTDFTKIIDRLRSLGLPVSNRRPSAPSAPLSSHSASNISMDRPVSSNRPSSSGGFKMPLRPNTVSSEDRRPDSTFSHISNQATRPQSTSSTSSVSNSHFSVASTLPFQGTGGLGESIYRSLFATDSLFVNQMQNEDRRVLSASQRVVEPVRALAAPPFFPPPQNYPINLAQSTTSLTDHLHQRSLSNQSKPPVFNTERPASTPSGSIDWDVWVPTRQPVPLSNPEDNNKCRSLSGLSLLPIPTPVISKDSAFIAERTAENDSVLVRKTATKRVAQRRSSLDKLQVSVVSPENPSGPGPTGASVTDTYLHQDEPSPLAAKTAAASRPSSAAPGLQSKAIASKKRGPLACPPSARPPSAAKRPKMVDQATQTQIICLPTQPKVPTLASNTSEKSVSVIRPASLPEEYLGHVDAFVTKHKSRPAPKEISETPGYTAADEETRLAIVNDFICENLENEDFLTLCDDMGRSWQRIGLGIKEASPQESTNISANKIPLVPNRAHQDHYRKIELIAESVSAMRETLHTYP